MWDSLSVRDGQSMKLRLVKRTASGAWRWDPAGDRVFTARSGATYGLSWSSKQVQQVAAVSFRVSADVAAGERLYVVGEWGQGGNPWADVERNGVLLSASGDAYVGSLSVRDGQSMKLRLVKRTASGAWRWDPAGDRVFTRVPARRMACRGRRSRCRWPPDVVRVSADVAG